MSILDNLRPSGEVLVSGDLIQGATLTADTSTLADADGLGTLSFQWQRDGAAIPSATGASHPLSQADVGAAISVVVSYTDGQGAAESVTSAATSSVSNVNDAPSGAVAISGTARQGETLTADATGVSDVDGIDATTVAYQWLRGDTAISGATASTYELTQDDVGAAISVRYSYTDNFGTNESVTSAATSSVSNVNDAPSGAVAISGTARQGETLTADATGVSDVDGIDATTVAYQWLRGDTAISGATASTYELTQDDVGAAISVRYSYTDNFGTNESVTSAATSSV
ncbi:hypothetical protein, partial [Ruegeria sp. PrR005]